MRTTLLGASSLAIAILIELKLDIPDAFKNHLNTLEPILYSNLYSLIITPLLLSVTAATIFHFLLIDLPRKRKTNVIEVLLRQALAKIPTDINNNKFNHPLNSQYQYPKITKDIIHETKTKIESDDVTVNCLLILFSAKSAASQLQSLLHISTELSVPKAMIWIEIMEITSKLLNYADRAHNNGILNELIDNLSTLSQAPEKSIRLTSFEREVLKTTELYLDKCNAFISMKAA